MLPSMLTFIHIPKTGGTSLTQAIRAKHPRLLTLSTPEQFRAFRANPSLADVDAIVGHSIFGIHRHVNTTIEYVTVLRDPIDRIVSDYYYALHSPHRGELHRRIVDEKMGLATFVADSRYFMSDNGLVRFLAHYPFWELADDPQFWWRKVPRGQVSRDMLEQAKANLEMCAFVGFQDDLPVTPRENVTPDRPSINDLGCRTLGVLRDWHRLDLELYEWAQAFRSHMAGTEVFAYDGVPNVAGSAA